MRLFAALRMVAAHPGHNKERNVDLTSQATRATLAVAREEWVPQRRCHAVIMLMQGLETTRTASPRKLPS